MSIECYNHVLQLPIKPASKKQVALVLADFVTDTNKTYPQIFTINKFTGLTADAIKDHLEELCADKLIKDTGTRVGENKDVVVYQFNWEAKVQPKPKQKRPTKNPLLGDAEKIYELYPRKIGRPKALTAIAKQIKAYDFEIVKNGTELFAKAWKESGRTDLSFCPHASTFFNQERFLDDPSAWGLATAKKIIVGPTYKEVLEFIKTKETDVTKVNQWASGFFAEWKKRKWIGRDGKELEWKIELSAQIGRWRSGQ